MRTSNRSDRRRSFALIAGVVLMTSVAPLAGRAQDTVTMISSTPYAEPAEMLARLESGEPNISVVITAAFEKDRRINNHAIYRGNYDRYTDAERRYILDEIERIARGVGGNRSTADDIEIEAFSVLYSVSLDPELSEAYAIPDRLLRIYELSKTDEAKRTAVSHLGEVLRSSPTASPRIIKLLVSLVTQPVTLRRQGYHGMIPVFEGPVHPDDALDALLRACEAGVPALRQLAADRASIQHDDVRARIDSIADRGLVPGSVRLRSGGKTGCTAETR